MSGSGTSSSFVPAGARRAPAANATGAGGRSSGHAPRPPGAGRSAGSRTLGGRREARQWAREARKMRCDAMPTGLSRHRFTVPLTAYLATQWCARG